MVLKFVFPYPPLLPFLLLSMFLCILGIIPVHLFHKDFRKFCFRSIFGDLFKGMGCLNGYILCVYLMLFIKSLSPLQFSYMDLYFRLSLAEDSGIFMKVVLHFVFLKFVSYSPTVYLFWLNENANRDSEITVMDNIFREFDCLIGCVCIVISLLSVK